MAWAEPEVGLSSRPEEAVLPCSSATQSPRPATPGCLGGAVTPEENVPRAMLRRDAEADASTRPCEARRMPSGKQWSGPLQVKGSRKGAAGSRCQRRRRPEPRRVRVPETLPQCPACSGSRSRRILGFGGRDVPRANHRFTERVKVLVLGGGIAGVTAAYFLAKDGHEVDVLEEQDGVGQDASGGNAGMIAPGHSFAWASPTRPGHAPPLAPRPGDRHPRAAPPGSRARRLGPPVPPRVHRDARAAQHARQAPPVPVQPGRDDRAGRRRGDRVPRRRTAAPSTSIGTRASWRRASGRWRCWPSTASARRSWTPAQVARLEPGVRAGRDKIAGAVRDLGDSSGDSRLFTESWPRSAATSWA